MDWTTLSTFLVFIAIMTGTPGPGNLTFMAIGASAGYRTALPVILACQTGNLLMNICVAFGLGQLMAQGGIHVTLFKIACMAYMLYLAYRIIHLNISPRDDVKPPGFWEGFLIHPLSPKTWAMSTVAYTSFFASNGQHVAENALYLCTGFLIGGLVAHSIWALAGASILKVLGDGPVLKTTTITMAVGMVGATAWSLVL